MACLKNKLIIWPSVMSGLFATLLFALVLSSVEVAEARKNVKRAEWHLPTLFSESGKGDIIRAEDWKAKERTQGGALDLSRVSEKDEETARLHKAKEQAGKGRQAHGTAPEAPDSHGVAHPEDPHEHHDDEHEHHADAEPHEHEGHEEHADEHYVHHPDWAEMGDGVAADSMEEAIHGIPKGSTLFVTFADKNFREFLKNWVLHCRQAGIGPIVIGAMDDEILKFGRELNVRVFSMQHSIDSFGWGAQIGIIEALHEHEFDVLMSDVDTAWLKDPMPFFTATKARADSDLIISSDCASCMGDEAKGLCISAPFNIGIMLWRRGPVATGLITEWVENLKKKGGVGYMMEQLELNEILRGSKGERMFPLQAYPGTKTNVRGATLISRTPHGPFTVTMLPAGQFTHGHIYFVAEVPQRLDIDVYVVHATYQFGDGREGQAQGKKQRFKEHGLWMVDEDDYYTEGKYLTYTGVVPEWVNGNTTTGIERHMLYGAYHFKAIRNALALAQALGRILVLPRFQCYCDRHWTPIETACIMANSDLKLPFFCPMDHLFEVMRWTKAGVVFREPGFLQHPKFLGSGDDSTAFLHVEGSEAAPLLREGLEDGAQAVKFPRKATDAEARKRVQEAGLEGTRVLHFSSPYDAFCTFEDEATMDRFNRLTLGIQSKDIPPGATQIRGLNRGSGILNGLSWCCENKDPKGYAPGPREFQMPWPLFPGKC